MPITKSAKKNLRKSEKRRLRNLRKKRKIKELKKKIQNLLKEKKVEEAEKILPLFYKALDKAAKTGVIKENKAAREKSKMAKLIFKVVQETNLKPTQDQSSPA